MRNALLIVAACLIAAGTLLFAIDLGLVVSGLLVGAFVLLTE